MIKTSISKFAGDIGFDIANMDDETQAKLINGFCRGLTSSMTPALLRTQVCYMVRNFSENAKEVLKEINQFIELSESKEK